MNKYFKWKILLIFVLTAAAIWEIYPSSTWKHFPATDQINLGLDLQGGMHLILRVDLNAVPETAREDAADRALEVIRNRIDQFGVREPVISRQGHDQIIVQLPGVTDDDRVKDIIGKTALLEFRLVADDPDLVAKARETKEAGEIPEGYEWLTMEDERTGSQELLVEKKSGLTGDHLVNANVQFDSSSFGQPIVSLEFDQEGGTIFAEITSNAAAQFRKDGIPRRLAIVLDGELRTAPQMKEAIAGGRAVIEGNFTYEEASDTALVLRAGALPAPVLIEEERTVGPALGRDSIRQSIRAVLFGGLAVVAFIAVYYLYLGLIADFALLLNLVLIMGAMSLFRASLTLPGIAGIILTIGMSVDANVLIYERIREELKLGKATRSAISSGYLHAQSAIWDSNITTLFTSLIMFYFGTGPIRGFAVTLSIGIVTSVFTALFVTRVVLDFLTRGGRPFSLRMLSFFRETKIDFIRYKIPAYLLSAAVVLAGIVVFVKRGDKNYGIDFTGGALQQVRFTQSMSISDVRAVLSAEGLGQVQIQEFGAQSSNEVLIRGTVEEAQKVKEVLTGKLGADGFDMLRYETVGPAAGSQLRGMAIKSFAIALIGMLIYISIRFKFVYAVGAIVALFHDVIVTAGVFAMTGREFSLPIVAALLTIVGYSINDTIVIFDRIRENLKIMRRTAFLDVVNKSINETLGRTILTSLTVLFVVLALYFFGGKVINDFAFTLLIGVISGCYSTVYVATAIVVDSMGEKARKG